MALTTRHFSTFTALLLVHTACSHPPRTMPIAPITATAPPGIDDHHLGAPVDVHFRPLQGSIAGSLFPHGQIARLPQTYVSHEVVTIRDSLQFNANLAAWSLIDASLGVGKDSRYATYRAFQVAGISSIDDRTEIDDPPPEAAFYVAKIYWGHSFEAVFEGNSRNFNASIGAQLVTFQGDVGLFASTNRLRAHFIGKGLQPKTGNAIFARSEGQILNAYTTDGPPTPIFVEYRAIPNGQVADSFLIPYAPALKVIIRFNRVRVIEDGTWGSTPWSLQASCGVDGSMLPPVRVLSDDRVEAGGSYSTNATLELLVAPWDTLECTSEGTFSDHVSQGTIAPGRSSPFQVQGPGVTPMQIVGNGKASYRIEAIVEIRQAE